MTPKQNQTLYLENRDGQYSGLPSDATVIPFVVLTEPDSHKQKQEQPRTCLSEPRSSLQPASSYASLALKIMESQPSHPEAPPRHPDDEPIRKRQRLEQVSPWIDQALQRGHFERSLSGQPDPFPFPEGYGLSQSETGLLPLPVRQRQHSHQSLGPPNISGLPTSGVHLSLHSRRSSSVTSATGFTGSPAPSHGTVVSATRYEATPPGSSVGVSGVSELDVESRAGSAPPDHGDASATFERIHDVPYVTLGKRQGTALSVFEELPKAIFMRVLMYCDYKQQILLKRCSSNLYHRVDLEAIPWEEKTATILNEERYNPTNFPKKPPKVKDRGDSVSGNDGDGGAVSDGEVQATVGTTKMKRPQQKTKPDPVILGRWGCYTCYKILPPQYFEGPLLEDEDGRGAKSQRNRGSDATDTDKKVDMRVEYIQVLGIVPARPLPDWLTSDKEKDTARKTDGVEEEDGDEEGAEPYKGVSLDDLRAYYSDINKETHLMAPLRGVTPVFVEATYGVSRASLDDSMRHNEEFNSRSTQTTLTKLNTAPFPSVSAGEMPTGCETSRPLYCQGAKRALRGDAEIGRHFYELCIPHGSKRDINYLTLPSSRPAGRIILPQKESCDAAGYIERPVVEIDDVIALRRICIPCGAKYGVYRRDCNRKIVSKTGEEWWVCGCRRVRQTGRSRGCPDCGKRTIY